MHNGTLIKGSIIMSIVFMVKFFLSKFKSKGNFVKVSATFLLKQLYSFKQGKTE